MRSFTGSSVVGGPVLIALTQEPPVEPTTSDDTFHDLVDVVSVAVPLAFAVLLLAVSWPNVKRWVRHRLRRRRRRRHHDAHAAP